MLLKVNDQCIGCRACLSVENADKIFEFDDKNNKVIVKKGLKEDDIKQYENAIIEAKNICPMQAIEFDK